MTDNSNKTALVTGASRGIGRATARALADAGTRVVIHYGSGIRSSGARRSVLFNKSSAALSYTLSQRYKLQVRERARDCATVGANGSARSQ